MITEKKIRNHDLSIDTCYHEAGHSVVARIKGFDVSESRVSILNTGSTAYSCGPEATLTDRLAALLGGPIAHRKMEYGSGNNLKEFQSLKDFTLISQLLKQYSVEFGSDYQDWWYSETKKDTEALVNLAYPVIKQVAEKLYSNHIVSGYELDEIISTYRNNNPFRKDCWK